MECALQFIKIIVLCIQFHCRFRSFGFIAATTITVGVIATAVAGSAAAAMKSRAHANC